jgi:hypothetical protein
MSNQAPPSNNNGQNTKKVAEQEDLKEALALLDTLPKNQINALARQLSILVPAVLENASPKVAADAAHKLNVAVNQLNAVPTTRTNLNITTVNSLPPQVNVTQLPPPPNSTPLAAQSAGKKNQKNQKKLKNNKK